MERAAKVQWKLDGRRRNDCRVPYREKALGCLVVHPPYTGLLYLKNEKED
jgi:hypothetical protein